MTFNKADITSKYEIKKLNEANFKDFHGLFEQVFKKVDMEVFKSKYEAKYIVDDYWVFMAYEKETGEIAASYGVIPWLFRDDKKVILAAQSVDTMTAPKHRGKGLFTYLHHHLAAYLVENGCQFIFGFPNQYSYPGFKKKLNWQFVGHLTHYNIKTKQGIPIRKFFYKIPLLKKIHDRNLAKHTSKYEVAVFNDESGLEDIFCTLRNDDFYKYKVKANHKVLKINHSTFLIKITNRIIIGDIVTQNAATLKEDMNQLIKLAESMGITELDFLCSQGRLNSMLSSFLEGTKSLPIGTFALSNIPYNFDSWRLTTIDLDTY